MVQPYQCPWSHRARGARKVGPGDRPLPEGIEVCRRSRSHYSSAWAGPVPNPTTHCRHSMRLSEKPASAMHRSWSSGRRSLSERPSTRCSNSRAVPAPGSAGPEGCPAHHASPSCGHEEKSLSTFFFFGIYRGALPSRRPDIFLVAGDLRHRNHRLGTSACLLQSHCATDGNVQ